MKNNLIEEVEKFAQACQLEKTAKIRKMPNGKYRVLSEKGKNMGTYNSREGAKKRLRQVEYFKHFDHAAADDIIDLTDIDEMAYSAIIRKLRQKTSDEVVQVFLKIFKQEFDKSVKHKINTPEKVALQNTLVKFNKLHKIRLDKKMVKSAAVSELGNAEQVGKSLADIVKFILNRLPSDKKQKAVENLKNKFRNLDASEIADKITPESAALGQSITFVKHVLFNHDTTYIQAVLNALVASL